MAEWDLLADSTCAIQIRAVSAKRSMAASAIQPPGGFTSDSSTTRSSQKKTGCRSSILVGICL